MDQKDMTEWYNERAAVYEYDGGLTRMEAEQRAWKELEELKKLTSISKVTDNG